MASGGDDDTSKDIVLDRTSRIAGDDYNRVNASSLQRSRPLTSSHDTQELGERQAECPLLLEHQAPLGSLDKVQRIPSREVQDEVIEP